jgi:hypothetical protein
VGGAAGTEPAAPQYDITSRAAGYDLFLAYLDEDADAVGRIARSLESMGLRVYFDRAELSAVADYQMVERRALQPAASRC